jgi:transposase-like protein
MSKIPRQSEVIKAYIEANGHVVRACKAAGVNRDTFYEWKRTDPNFAQKLMEAEEEVEEIKLNFAMSFLTKELKKEYKGRSNNEYRMKDSDLLSYIKTQIQLTKKGKQMLGIVPAPTTAETPDVVAITKILEKQAEKAINETPAPYTDDGTENDTNKDSY